MGVPGSRRTAWMKIAQEKGSGTKYFVQRAYRDKEVGRDSEKIKRSADDHLGWRTYQNSTEYNNIKSGPTGKIIRRFTPQDGISVCF